MNRIESLQEGFCRPVLLRSVVEMNSVLAPGTTESREHAFDRINAAIQNQIELLDLLADGEWQIEISKLESELIAAMGEKDAGSFIRAMRKRRVKANVLRAPAHN